MQFIPSNLQRFTSYDGKADLPANPALPDHQRDVQFTVNGQFQPTIKSKAGQTEIWVLANVSDFAYINLQLTETADWAPSEIRHRRPGRESLPQRPASGDRERHPASDSAGEPVRHRGNDTFERRACP